MLTMDPPTGYNHCNKKFVSFPDQVVSVVHSVESYDESLHAFLYYSADDYRRFKMERRQRKAENKKAHQSLRRKGAMYESLMAHKDSVVADVDKQEARDQAVQITQRYMTMMRLQPDPLSIQAF